MDTNGPLYGRLFALIVIIAYLAFFYITVRRTVQGLRVLWWKRTNGTITRSDLEVQVGSEEIYHIPQVTYTFEADGGSYTGKRIAIVGRHAKPAGAEVAYEIVQQYPVGKTVTVYYPADNPEQAVLKSGLSLLWLIRYALLIIIPVFTLGIFVTPEGPEGTIIATLTSVNERFLPVTAPIASNYGLGEDSAYLILGALFLLIVLFLPFVFMTLRALTRILFSLSWRRTDGEVILSRVQDFYRSTGEGSTHYFRPVVQYRYKVEDKNYTSTRLSWSGREKDEKRSGIFPKRRAEGVLKDYPVGTSVSVRYDPARPYVSTLRVNVPVIGLVLQILIILIVTLIVLRPQDTMLIFFAILDGLPK